MAVLDVCFVYQAAVRLPRKRTDTVVRVLETAPFHIQEISDSEAPVAIRMPSPDAVGAARKDPVVLRWHADSLWIAERTDGRFVGIEDVRSLLAAPPTKGRDPIWRGDTWLAQGAKRWPEFAPATLVVSDRDKRILEVQAQMDRHLFVGGRLHRRVAEPLCRLNLNGIGGIELVWADDGSGGEELFRLDEMDELRARTEALFEDLRGNLQVPRIDLLMPEVLRAEPSAPYLRHQAVRVLGLFKTRLVEEPMETMIVYAQVRDALRCDDLATVAEALPQLVRMCGHDHAFLANRVDYAVWRFQNRHASHAPAEIDLPVAALGA